MLVPGFPHVVFLLVGVALIAASFYGAKPQGRRGGDGGARGRGRRQEGGDEAS